MAFFDTTWYVNFGDGATTGYYAVPVWPGITQAVTAGTWCRQSAAPAVGSERCFVCTTAGTTGGAEPVWVVTRGANTGANIDGTVHWQECTGMAGPCGDTTNAPVWVASRVITLGECYYDAASGSLQICSTAGTSKSGAQPSFSATAGTPTADNTATWTSLGPTSNYTTAFKYPHARLANAFTATWGAAGNQFAISSIHAETQNTALTLTSPGTNVSPCAVFCILSSTTLTSPTLSTLATISTTGVSAIGIIGYVYIYGLKFQSGDAANAASININNATGGNAYFDTCAFNLTNTAITSRFNINGGGNNVTESFYAINCTFIFGSTSQSINNGGGTNHIIQNATIAQTGSVPVTLIVAALSGSVLTIRDTDLSAITGTIYGGGIGGVTIKLQNCKLGAAVTFNAAYSNSLMPEVHAHNCDSSNTNYRYYYSNYAGTVQQETTIIRTGSLATDGTTPISWNFTTTANSKYLQPFVSEEISIWNDTIGSVVTVTLYLISNTTLNNNDFWAEVEYAGTSNFPLGLSTNNRMTPLGTPAALTSDTSVWGGSTNKYKIVLTCTPQNKGPIKVRFYAAKATSTTYIDPYIYLS